MKYSFQVYFIDIHRNVEIDKFETLEIAISSIQEEYDNCIAYFIFDLTTRELVKSQVISWEL